MHKLSVATFGCTTLLIFLILFANSGAATDYIQLMMRIPFGDKCMHLFLLGSLSLLVNLRLSCQPTKRITSPYLLGSWGLFFLITLEEFSQIWIPSRNFEWIDLCCNYLGIFIGQQIAIAIYVYRYRRFSLLFS